MTVRSYADWTLHEWLEFLENRHLKEVQLRLVNPRKVAVQLDVLKWSIPVITISGTNGKGSTAASLQAIYISAGYKVGCFTSPHLLKFNERICVNNQQISDKELCNAFTQIENSRGDVHVTYFEASLLAALLHFKSCSLDVIILEVGVGGRLDATNIIDADLAIITTVDLDHQEYLGPDRESIGFEKAGIMRPYKTCIFADYSMPLSVIGYAEKISAKLVCLGLDYSYEVTKDNLAVTKPGAFNALLPIPSVNPKAAAAAIVASHCLSDILPVTSICWMQAMAIVKVLGRLQLLDKSVKILYDVSHNPQSVLLLESFIEENRPSGAIHAVFSGLVDKDLRGLIRPLAGLVNYWYPAIINHKRGSCESRLLDALKIETNHTPVCYKSPIDAYNAAAKSAKVGDLIVIYGSFLLVGAVMENFTYESIDIWADQA